MEVLAFQGWKFFFSLRKPQQAFLDCSQSLADNFIWVRWLNHTICPDSSYSFYIVTSYIKRVTISWTHSRFICWCSNVDVIYARKDLYCIEFNKFNLASFCLHCATFISYLIKCLDKFPLCPDSFNVTRTWFIGGKLDCVANWRQQMIESVGQKLVRTW